MKNIFHFGDDDAGNEPVFDDGFLFALWGKGGGVYFSGDFCRHGKPFFLHRWVGITTTHHLTKTHTQKRLEVYDIEFLPPRQPFDLHLSFVPFKESGGGAVMQRILG